MSDIKLAQPVSASNLLIGEIIQDNNKNFKLNARNLDIKGPANNFFFENALKEIYSYFLKFLVFI